MPQEPHQQQQHQRTPTSSSSSSCSCNAAAGTAGTAGRPAASSSSSIAEQQDSSSIAHTRTVGFQTGRSGLREACYCEYLRIIFGTTLGSVSPLPIRHKTMQLGLTGHMLWQTCVQKNGNLTAFWSVCKETSHHFTRISEAPLSPSPWCLAGSLPHNLRRLSLSPFRRPALFHGPPSSTQFWAPGVGGTAAALKSGRRPRARGIAGGLRW